MKSVFINSVGIIGPGIDNWSHCKKILADDEPNIISELPKLALTILPPNERRRTTKMIKLALHVAKEAITDADVSATNVSSVFASSNSDLAIVDRICSDLLLPDHPVSPIQFHNSVHNAPAGYWGIGTGSRRPSTSLSAGLYSAMAGLIEASTLALIESETVVLIIYDCPVDGLLKDIARVNLPFACAMVLTAQQTDTSFARIRLLGSTDAPCSKLKNDALGLLCSDNAAANTLLLLESIATTHTDTLEGTGTSIDVGDNPKTVSMPYAANLQYLVAVESLKAGARA